MNPVLTDLESDSDLAQHVLAQCIHTPTLERDYWKMFSCRTLGSAYSPREERIMRMDHTKTWEWHGDKLSQDVRRLVEPFTDRYYSHLTRVELLIQKPGNEVPCHKDRITGQQYGDFIAIRPFEDDWNRFNANCHADFRVHWKQHYLGGRLALGPQGLSYVLNEPPRKTYYETASKFFFLNEDVLHGAEPVDFWRGVVFVDGIHNADAMEQFYDLT